MSVSTVLLDSSKIFRRWNSKYDDKPPAYSVRSETTGTGLLRPQRDDRNWFIPPAAKRPEPAYSVRSAMTGSFLDAELDGIRPPIMVRMVAMATSTRAAGSPRTAVISSISVTL